MDKTVGNIKQQAVAGLAALAFFLWLALFLPAWSLNYWQGWIYWLVFLISVTAISIYFLRKDLTLIANRLKTGPTAEAEWSQKISQIFVTLFFILLLIVPSLDHRFGWSTVPVYVVITGDFFVALGLLIIFLVFRENSFTSSVVEVSEGQSVVSTGPYRVVRHLMYSGALLMLLFTPLALGSFWGTLVFPLMLIIIAFRLVEEEQFLAKNLKGYDEYRRKVRYRLIPLLW